MLAQWPQLENEVLYVDDDAITNFTSIQNIIRSIRNARAEYNVEAGKKISVIIQCNRPAFREQLSSEKSIISLLARVDSDTFTVSDFEVPLTAQKCVHLVIEDGIEAYIPMTSFLDRDKVSYFHDLY